MISKAPGVIKLLGEHAVVYGKLSLAAAINLYAYAEAEKVRTDGLEIELEDFKNKVYLSEGDLERLRKKYEAKESFDAYENGEEKLSLPYATIASVLAKRGSLDGIKIRIRSSIPIQKGYASSAACSTAFSIALSKAAGIELSDGELIELAREGDKVIHKNEGAGRIDVNTSYFGGIVSYSKDSGAKREEIDAELNLYIVDTGPKKSTAETVGHVANLYKSNKEQVEKILNEIDMLSKKGIESLKKKDINEFGRIMYRNQELLKQLGVSSEKLDIAVEKAKENNLLGAKLSGGGGGGIAIVLCNEGDCSHNLEIFKNLGFEVRKVNIDYMGAKGWIE